MGREVQPALELDIQEIRKATNGHWARHLMVETGMTLDVVRTTMAAEAFRHGVGVLYQEVEGLFSFTLNAGLP